MTPSLNAMSDIPRRNRGACARGRLESRDQAMNLERVAAGHHGRTAVADGLGKILDDETVPV